MNQQVEHLARFVLAALAGLLLTTGGCSKSDETRAAEARAPREAVAVTLAPVTTGPIQRYIAVVGTLYGDEEVTVSAKVAGRIVAIYHDMGDRVPRGGVLAQIDPTDFELARSQKQAALGQSLSKLGLTAVPSGDFDPESVPTVQRARLEAANAEAKFNRGKQLHDQDPPRLSAQEFADLRTAWDVAQSNYNIEVLTARSTLAEARVRAAELRQADQMLSDATIRAPAAATTMPSTAPLAVPITPGDFSVAERMTSVGEYVREGTPLFKLIDDDPIRLRAAVPERYLDQVKVGQSVQLSVEAYPEPFVGQITRINPQVDPASRNFTIEAVVSNEGGALRPGGFAQARIATHVDPEALFVPQEAIVSFAGVNRVFTVRDGKAVEHQVTLGERLDGRVEVVSGFAGGQTVVVQNAGKLANDAPVRVSETP